MVKVYSFPVRFYMDMWGNAGGPELTGVHFIMLLTSSRHHYLKEHAKY